VDYLDDLVAARVRRRRCRRTCCWRSHGRRHRRVST